MFGRNRNRKKLEQRPQSPDSSKRSGEDRRDSPRIPVKMRVRPAGLGGAFEERTGDISVGGVYFTGDHVSPGSRVEMCFSLAQPGDEIRCLGEVFRVSESDGQIGAHVRFIDLSTDTELVIARFIDDRQLSNKGSDGKK
jgi:hypothetical protein